ncbi:hypothetical protein CDCA_CDCA19G4700 [Cyanidium caldarium]|uniref:Uncharacterized protein n=1 Tax=Cyanidium caldarium TaxID=2771 RepID=A0AAV9J2S1_CYACA|nr:hypothetical protein CDCA_CDCA19G4700 [Cyanidium caldarium]
MSGASPSRSDTVRLLLRDSDALGRLLSRAVIVGNVLSVGVLLVMYATFQLFRGYVTSALLGLIASIALHDTKQEWAFRLAGHLPASHHTRLQSRPPLSWRARVLLPALALLAVRSRPWFITLASATAAAAAAALFVWLSARAAVRAGAVDAHTAAALLIIAALLSAMCAAALVLSLGIVEDVVSAMRSLAYAVRAALRARQWDKSSAATKALEQVQAYLATHAEAAESLGRRAHAMAREVGLDMDNPNAWWVRGSDPAEWRRWAASASSGPLNLSSLMSLHSTDVRAGWRRFCAMLRQQSLSTAQLSLVWKRLRAAFPTERWLALARSSLGYASAAVRYVGVVASYIDGLGAFLAIVLVLLRQPTSVLTPLIRCVPFRDARANVWLERQIRRELHDAVWSTVWQASTQALLAWTVFVAIDLEMEFLVAFGVGASAVLPIVPGPLVWYGAFGLPQMLTRHSGSVTRWWLDSALFGVAALLATRVLSGRVASRWQHKSLSGSVTEEERSVTLLPHGVLALAALLGWRVYGGVQGALVAYCVASTAAILVRSIHLDEREWDMEGEVSADAAAASHSHSNK